MMLCYDASEAKGRHLKQTLLRNTALLVAVFCGTVSALVLGCYVLGPVVRIWVGEPRGFHEDYTSGEAVIQALTIQALSMSFAFVVVGIIVGERVRDPRWGSVVALVNPVTVGLSYLPYRLLASGNRPYEYFSFSNWICVSLLAPVLFAPLLLFGVALRQKRGSNPDPQNMTELLKSWPLTLAMSLVVALCLLLIPALTNTVGRAIDPRLRR